MKIGKGMVAGLGIASLLIALPAGAQSSSSPGSSGSSGSMGSSGSTSDTSKDKSSAGSTGSSSDTSGSMGSSALGGTASAGAAGQHEITGKVEKLDRTKKELSLRLKVSDDTQVMKDGQRASLSDIKEGDQVRASFTGSGDTLQVQRIDVMSSAKGGAVSPGAPSGAPSSTPGGSTGGAPGGSSQQQGGSSGRGY